MDDSSAKKDDSFLLWIDLVGGYLVSLADEVTLGQPATSGGPDIPILGDLSKRHARIRRDGEGYLIEAMRPVWVDDKAVHGVASLADGNRIQLGDSVRLVFRRPHALSATARLEFDSPHRTQPSVDGLLLMADSCVLGPKPHSHVVCRDWPDEVVLYRHENDLYCRSPLWLEIDGVRVAGKADGRRRGGSRARVTLESRIVGERLALSLERR